MTTDLPANIQLYVFEANLLGGQNYQEPFQFNGH
jgi:hypothetical protein